MSYKETRIDGRAVVYKPDCVRHVRVRQAILMMGELMIRVQRGKNEAQSKHSQLDGRPITGRSCSES